jgi:galactose mutarotase-like enzyme
MSTPYQGHVPASPTGKQWIIGHGRQQAVVTEVGATLREYTVDGVHQIDGFTSSQWSHSGRGQVLAPWPNRLANGRYEFGGLRAQAALDEPDRSNAIHGLVRWLPWEVEAHAQNVISLSLLLHPRPGYPFSLSLRIEYRLGREGLSITTTAANAGAGPLPFGLGFHPYLMAGPERIDTSVLKLPANERLILDTRGLPTGESAGVRDTEFDFLVPRAVGGTQMDTAFTALTRDVEGLAWASLDSAAGDHGVEIWLDERFTYLMVYTGDTLAEPFERRRAVAIEPMTCPPNAFCTARDVIVLEPGQSWSASWGLRPR